MLDFGGGLWYCIYSKIRLYTKGGKRMLEYKGHTIEHTESTIVIDGERVKVIENREFAYKINKRSISAKDGASGLYAFLKYHIEENFATVWVDAVINGVYQIANRK